MPNPKLRPVVGDGIARGRLSEQQGDAMSFGRHLRALRDRAGLSRSGLARQAGVPAGTLRNWESDRGFPSLAACVRLAEGVGDPAGDDPEPAVRKRSRSKKG
jgi:transcriptional regulator with XRE-family HTH domain